MDVKTLDRFLNQAKTIRQNQDRIAQLEEENKKLKEKNEDFSKRITALEEENKALRKNNEDLLKQVGDQEATLKQHDKYFSELFGRQLEGDLKAFWRHYGTRVADLCQQLQKDFWVRKGQKKKKLLAPNDFMNHLQNHEADKYEFYGSISPVSEADFRQILRFKTKNRRDVAHPEKIDSSEFTEMFQRAKKAMTPDVLDGVTKAIADMDILDKWSTKY